VRVVARFQTSLVESGSAVRLVVVSVVVEERTAVLAMATAAAVVGGDLVVMVPVMVGLLRCGHRQDKILAANLQTGSGEVAITKVSTEFAGTPGKANCHGKSVSALAKQYGGLAAAAALGFACGCGRRIEL